MGTKNLQNFFDPLSVAIVGASHDQKKLGYIVLENFVRENFHGMLFPVNPDTTPILGKEVYPSVKKIPEKVDLAVVIVPAFAVSKVLKECVEKKISNVIVISSGFSEIGGRGIVLEQRLKKIIEVAKGRTSVVGPNCIGVFNPKTKIDTMFLSRERLRRPREGNIAFISQSGAVGSTVLDWLAQEGIGISKFVSYGNGIDVNETDFLEFFADDKDTHVVAMYLEGMKGEGEEFLQAMRKTTSKKPVVVLKAGKTEKGTKAAASHTGSLAGSARIYSGAFKQTNTIEAGNWEELFDFVKTFSMQPPPKGNKLAIITDGGGFGVLATDEAERQKLELPEPSLILKKKLQSKMPAHVKTHNPMDVTGDANMERYWYAMEAMLGSKEYDGAVVISLMQVPTLEPKIVDAVVEMKKFEKPILVCAVGSDFTQRVERNFENNRIPVFPTPERAVRAFAAMWNYKKYLQK
ncbi:MAG TPA: CoA-binding protein [archaeon]|nr:CoA-binding protein [archaeon]